MTICLRIRSEENFFLPTPSWLSPGRYTRSTAQFDMQGDETDGQIPFFVEPSREPSPKTPQPPRLPQATQLDPVTASYYEPATAEEFRAHRRCLERQETMSFGPIRGRMFQSTTATSSNAMPPSSTAMPAPPRPPDTHGAGPYSEPPKEEDHFGLRAWQSWPWIFGLRHR